MNSIDKKTLKELREKHKDVLENPAIQKMAGEILDYKPDSDNINEAAYIQKCKDNVKYFLR
jgi:hypothetical protein